MIQEGFFKASDDWLNYQKGNPTDQTFKTTAQTDFQGPCDQTAKFSLRQTGLTKDQDQLKEYNDKWTKGGQNFNRIYVGAKPFKKANQEE